MMELKKLNDSGQKNSALSKFKELKMKRDVRDGMNQQLEMISIAKMTIEQNLAAVETVDTYEGIRHTMMSQKMGDQVKNVEEITLDMTELHTEGSKLQIAVEQMVSSSVPIEMQIMDEEALKAELDSWDNDTEQEILQTKSESIEDLSKSTNSNIGIDKKTSTISNNRTEKKSKKKRQESKKIGNGVRVQKKESDKRIKIETEPLLS